MMVVTIFLDIFRFLFLFVCDKNLTAMVGGEIYSQQPLIRNLKNNCRSFKDMMLTLTMTKNDDVNDYYE